ncbi:hypothetical protein [Synechocystis sp. LKSZ1]|uniref:hypothetical protein n=1 Tax=Synechocystis sp. LKSZ1 TaxID=3144951 RepID=UPI00336BD1B4
MAPNISDSSSTSPRAAGKKAEKLVSINIKIPQSQKEWLGNTAYEVRSNNTTPVPPSERVFPQHLISVAIALLQATDIDWSQIKSEQELRQYLDL